MSQHASGRPGYAGRQHVRQQVLVRILKLVQEGRHDREALARLARDDEFGNPIASRTLARYMVLLKECGHPIEYDHANKVYRFADGYSLIRVDLTEEQHVALLAIHELAQAMHNPLGDRITEVLTQFTTSKDPVAETQFARFDFRLHKTDMSMESRAIFDTIHRAMLQHHGITFEYTDKHRNRTARNVNPYGFKFSLGRIYLIAFDNDKRAERVFAIDSIEKVMLTPAIFSMPIGWDIHKYGEQSVSGLYDSDKTQVVHVRIQPHVARQALAATDGLRANVETEPDGSIVLTFHSAEPGEFIQWAFSYGSAATVIGPPNIVKRAQEMLRVMLDNYAGLALSSAS